MLPAIVTAVLVLSVVGTAVVGTGGGWPGVVTDGVGERAVDPRVASPGSSLGSVDSLVPAVGARLQADTAAVLFLNQSSDGRTVTVARAHLPRGGFVSVHDSTLRNGSVIGSIRGTSGYLDPGSHSSVTVRLDDPITESRTLIAVPYTDTNGNETYDYVASKGTEDVPYESDRGEVVTDDATVTVETNAAPTAVLQYSPFDPRPGETVAFDATDSDDPDGRIVGYEWRIRSRNPPLLVTSGSDRSTTFEYAFGDVGEYDVTLTVEDDDGAQDTATTTVVIGENTPPKADFEFTPADPDVGETIGFDGTVSTDDRGVVSYLWDLDGDGRFDEDTSRVSHAFDAGGRYPVTLLVSDGEGATDRTTRTVVVREANAPPVAAFEFSPAVPLVGESVAFDATGSTDDRRIVSYEWDLDGDGSGDVTGRVVGHTFETAGERTVGLTVRDDDGVTALTTRTVTVVVPPTPEPTPTGTATGTATATGAGTATTATSTPRVAGPGDWPLPLRPEDAVAVGGVALVGVFAVLFREELAVALRDLYLLRPGQATPRGGRTRPVREVPDLDETEDDEEDDENRTPTASIRFAPEEPTVGRPVRFDGLGSTDPDGYVTTHRWSGDGPERSGSVVVHTFEDGGEHEVTLTVEDDDGATGEATVTVDVEPAAGELALLEVNPDSPGRDHESLHLESLTFGNVGQGPLDVEGWTIHDAAEEEDRVREGEHTYAFDGTLELDPESTVTLYTGVEPEDAPPADADGAHHRYWGRTWPAWNNEGDTVVVKDADANPVLAARYERADEGYEVEPIDVERLGDLFPDAERGNGRGETSGM
ncbi:MAG: PKD domain-containing protein [Haloarculaceae archaeon]